MQFFFYIFLQYSCVPFFVGKVQYIKIRICHCVGHVFFLNFSGKFYKIRKCMDKKRRFRDQFLAFVISGRLLLYVMAIIEQQLVIKILLPHLTPASSTWEQSFTPHPL